jgi:hypothetical protein
MRQERRYEQGIKEVVAPMTNSKSGTVKNYPEIFCEAISRKLWNHNSQWFPEVPCPYSSIAFVLISKLPRKVVQDFHKVL